MAARLRRRGFRVESIPHRPAVRHLGVVHAVQYDAQKREFLGAADLIYDGTAAGPRPPLKPPASPPPADPVRGHGEALSP